MPVKIFDTHAHLNFNIFKDDRDEIIKNCLDKNIWVINVGSQYDTSKTAAQMAEKYKEGIYAAIGIHPIHLSQTEVDEEEIFFKSREERFDRDKYKNILNNKVVAIGEIGLDYFHIPKERNFNEIRKIQKDGFALQLNFAREFNLPVILHCRGSKDDPFGAYEEMIDILSDFVVNSKGQKKLRGVIHCFGANLQIAKKFVELGFYIGFTGIITFKNAKDLQGVVRNIPLEKILAETDCPYLAPDPFRGKRNEPAYAEYVVRKIAELKGLDFEEVRVKILDNSRGVFGV
ncbi:MAG: TatD family hydrolase [bacterium]